MMLGMGWGIDIFSISVRGREAGDLGTMSVDEFIRRIAYESDNCITC